ncbi:MAG: Mth938-like domain-containing protein [Woeseiaceae bacterium]
MTGQVALSPRIDELSWGRMVVDGVGSGKDFKLWPGGGRAWDWTETGTHHVPGIQPADVEELLARGSRAIVLTKGMLLRLRTCAETLSLLEAKGIAVYVAETRQAAGIYNELAARGEAVGGLFHSTC